MVGGGERRQRAFLPLRSNFISPFSFSSSSHCINLRRQSEMQRRGGRRSVVVDPSLPPLKLWPFSRYDFSGLFSSLFSDRLLPFPFLLLPPPPLLFPHSENANASKRVCWSVGRSGKKASQQSVPVILPLFLLLLFFSREEQEKERGGKEEWKRKKKKKEEGDLE